MTKHKTLAKLKLPRGKYVIEFPPHYNGRDFLRWSNGKRSPKREIVLDSDTKLFAIYEKGGILSHYLGKIGEYKALDELLKLTLDVYIPIIDVRGIDYIVRLQSGEYREIQVKTRGAEKQGKELFYVRNFDPRESLFIVCYREDLDEFWILPSKVYKNHAYKMKDGRLRLRLNQKRQKELEDYNNNWSLISKF